MRRPAPRSRLSWDGGYRMPTNLAWILRERRPRPVVNRSGTGPVLFIDQLNPEQRRRFDIQMAAFLAAEELTHFTALAAKYGHTLEDNAPYARWAAARRIWHRYLEIDDERGNP